MEARSRPATTEPLASGLAGRSLLVQDGLKFFTLTVIALVVATVTSLLFRGFERQREHLAENWVTLGRTALQRGRPDDAVRDLRAGMVYRPGESDDQLLLAEALARSGHRDQAETYFLSLWQARPGDGAINLQLARLERERGHVPEAVGYYRAAVFGTWNGQAIERRRNARMELSRYLIAQGQMEAARAELLIMSSNNPDGPAQLAVGEALDAAGDPRNAFRSFQQAARTPTLAAQADRDAGELCYRAGDYTCAADKLGKALRASGLERTTQAILADEYRDATQLNQLAASGDMPAPERAARLLLQSRVAQRRLRNCTTGTDIMGTESVLQPLATQWKALESANRHNALENDAALGNEFAAQTYRTEMATARICGTPLGEDALLLYLHDHPMTKLGGQ